MRYNQKVIFFEPGNSISKSNELALSNFDLKLSLTQWKLIYYSIYHLQHTSVEKFTKKEFEKFMNHTKLNSNVVSKNIESLSKVHVIFSKDKSIKLYQYLIYENGFIYFEFTDEIIEHIDGLMGNFILIPASFILNFNSIYSWKLYEFLLANYGFHSKYYSIEELLSIFNIKHNEAYANNISMFNQRVIKPAIADINNHTELQVSIKPVSYKKKIIGLHIEWSKGKLKKLISKHQKDDLLHYINTFEWDNSIYKELPNHLQNEMNKLSKNVKLINDKIHEGMLYEDYDTSRDILISTTTRTKEIINLANENTVNKRKIILEDFYIR